MGEGEPGLRFEQQRDGLHLAERALPGTRPSVDCEALPCEGFARKYCLYQGYTLGTPEFDDCVANYILTFCEGARAPVTTAQMLAILRD